MSVPGIPTDVKLNTHLKCYRSIAFTQLWDKLQVYSPKAAHFSGTSSMMQSDHMELLCVNWEACFSQYILLEYDCVCYLYHGNQKYVCAGWLPCFSLSLYHTFNLILKGSCKFYFKLVFSMVLDPIYLVPPYLRIQKYPSQECRLCTFLRTT